MDVLNVARVLRARLGQDTKVLKQLFFQSRPECEVFNESSVVCLAEPVEMLTSASCGNFLLCPSLNNSHVFVSSTEL